MRDEFRRYGRETVLATVVHWFLYAPAGITVLSLAAILVVAVSVQAVVMVVAAGVVAVLTRLLARARPDAKGPSLGAARGHR